jgi:hypothetical protein
MERRAALPGFLVLLAVLVAAGPTLAQQPKRASPAGRAPSGSVELVGRTGGLILAVAVSGRYAYAGISHQLAILDVNDPQHPALVGQGVPLPEAVQDVAVAGGYAYVAAGLAGLRIVDVSNPATPQEVGALATLGPAQGVAIAGNYAYLAAGSGGLRIVNVANPANPQEVGGLALPGSAKDVVVAGNYAYVAAGSGGLRIVDITNAANPRRVGSSRQSSYEDARGVVVAGGYAFIADVGFFDDDFQKRGGLRVVDVSNPSKPRKIGLFLDKNALAVAASENYVYVASYNAEFSTGALRVADVATPTSPRPRGSYVAPLSLRPVTAAGNYLYGLGARLHTIDTSDPAQPRQVSALSLQGSPGDLAVNGSHAYVAMGSGGLRIVDVSDPIRPRVVGRLTGDAWDVAATGAHAYISEGYGGLRIVDVSNPASPQPVGFFAGQWSVSDMAVAGNLLYVVTYAGSNSGLLIIDVGNPGAPHEVGFLQIPGTPRVVQVAGSYAYVAGGIGSGALAIIDVSDPSHPHQVGVHSLAHFPNDLAVAGSRAYLTIPTFPGGGLKVIDVSNPQAPQEVGDYLLTGGFALSVAALDGDQVGVGTTEDLLILRFADVASSDRSNRGATKRKVRR